MGKKAYKQLFNLSINICNEHYKMTLTVDKSIAYLWHLKKSHVENNKISIFIFLAEVNLLAIMNSITTEEKNNLSSLLRSEDIDNKYIAVNIINYFRNERIKKYGEFESINDPNYDAVKDYTHKIIKYELFNNSDVSVF